MGQGANVEKRDEEAVDRWINRLGEENKSPQQRRVSGYSAPLPTLAVAARTSTAAAAMQAAVSTVRAIPLARRPLGIRFCVGLSLALGVALPYWPYSSVCGWGFVVHAVAVGVLIIAGVWTSILTWYGRLGISHVVAILIFCWGLTLTALEVLPRTGYAKSEATWWCKTN